MNWKKSDFIYLIQKEEREREREKEREREREKERERERPMEALQKQLEDFTDGLDKTIFRPLQKKTFLCSSKCCDDVGQSRERFQQVRPPFWEKLSRVDRPPTETTLER